MKTLIDKPNHDLFYQLQECPTRKGGEVFLVEKFLVELFVSATWWKKKEGLVWRRIALRVAVNANRLLRYVMFPSSMTKERRWKGGKREKSLAGVGRQRPRILTSCGQVFFPLSKHYHGSAGECRKGGKRESFS